MTQPNHGPIPDDLVHRIREYYRKPGNGVGGSLHVVLDDGNIDDAHVEFCRTYAADVGDTEGQALAVEIMNLSRTQRGKLLRLNFYPWAVER